MKKVINRLAAICKNIFGYGIMITLFAGGFTFVGYLLAFLLGGDMAIIICEFIYKKLIPIIIYSTTVLILLGLFSMYLAGETALTTSNKKK